MTKREQNFIERNMGLALSRIQRSVSGYVLVRKFSLKYRTGLKLAREQGLVTIIDTCFGRAYRLED